MALSKADLQKKKDTMEKKIKMFDTEGGGDDGTEADGFISKQEMVKILTRRQPLPSLRRPSWPRASQ